MPSNFDFLLPNWATLNDDARQAEQNVFAAPRTCAFYARRAMERMVKWLYDRDGDLRKPYQDNLAALIHEPTFRDILPPGLFHQIRLIHKVGNLAVHSDTTINPQDGVQVTRMLHAFLGWAVRVYSTPSPTIGPFDDGLIPRPAAAPAADRTAEQLQKLQEQLAARDEALAAREAVLRGTQEEIDRLRRQITELRAANEQAVPEADYSEAATRSLFIDVMLREAEWDPHGADAREYPVIGMPNESGEGFVDNVMWGRDKLPLALLETKRTGVSPANGKQQAKLYADCLEQMTGQRPIIYYSNGFETWMWDDLNYPPRQVQGFYKQDELQLLINRRSSRQPIATAPINQQIIDRPYHYEAIRRVMETYGLDRQRAALLVMATGTGKTRLAIATVDLLMQQNWVRRVLFLADRNALLTQAKREFKRHLPHTTPVDLTQEKEKDDSRIIFSTYPTMMNCIDDERRDGVRRFGVGHFDLVIIDEAHRSVYQKYRAIFEYYDSLLLGLTATPRSEVDRDTYGLFGLEQGVPTFAYELDQAVRDGFLVPFRPITVPTKFSRQGIKYKDLSDDEKARYEEEFYDEETGTMPAEIDSAALNQWLFNKDTVDKILAVLMERGLKIEGGDKLGKTIIFAANHNHAEFIVERFDVNYPHLKGQFCRLIDNQVKYAQSLIDDFYVGDRTPQIAVSVDMLDTGIDVPECVNLVFFKRVRSKTKFWQMIGRGTRLCPDLFGPGQDKECFYVFDCCENLEFFGENPEGYEAKTPEPVKQRIFRRRLNLVDRIGRLPERDAALETLRSDLLDTMHQDVTRMNPDNFVVRPHRRQLEKYSQRDAWNQLGPSELVEIGEHLTGLPTPDEDDEFARRFDLLLLNLQLSILEGTGGQVRYAQQVRDIAQGLVEKGAIPAVRAHLELILELQSDDFWEGVTLPMLEDVRRRLRSLVQFLDLKGGREKVYTDFQDEIGTVTDVPWTGYQVNDFRNYRLKVERFVWEHQTHVTIHRLKHNQPIHAADIEALESILFSEGGPCSRIEFVSAYGTDTPLGKLVREIVGLDRSAAQEAFAEFLTRGNLTADQMTFLGQIVDHLVHNGTMDPNLLFGPPFTDFHDNGIVGVLPQDAQAIVRTIQAINGNALVA